MGTVYNADICHQCGEAELDRTFAAFMLALAWKTRASIGLWQAMRNEAYPDEPKYVYFNSSYPDVCPAFTMASISKWIDEIFHTVCRCQRRRPFSG
jgi:hypothetical protein